MNLPVVALVSILCPRVPDHALQVDGLLEDWSPSGGGSAAAPDRKSAEFTVRCAYDSASLYFAVDVTDDRLIRSRDRAADDHLVLGFGAVRLVIYPASDEAKAPRFVAWSDRKKRGLKLQESLQPRGWSVELGLPLREVPGWRARVPSLPFRLEFHDADFAAHPRIENVVVLDDTLVFEEPDTVYRRFLADLGLKPSELRVDTSGDFGDGPRRVVAAGRYIGVLDDGYVYLELPVDGANDLLEVRVLDLGGQGKASLLVRTVERGNGGSREVLSVWSVTGSRFARVFAHEIGKQQGTNGLTNRWELRPGKKQKGYDLVITPGELRGWTPGTWNESPAEDMAPIMLPWNGKAKEIWHFQGDTVSGG